ncbi:uncharacterized protein Tco025E_08195 [Trypanosoma conorhini]|uniref:Uncharacterized protein n=1 Tax=Trypanosoma conorhini TaxID=83891 RepID=A0A422NCY4_9TRYP|nr:uncharacterized protein Tco025E_08195 [Trypanosoma conorhini]RNF03338.1 hypothetical protein Tco025E_08195 [Trypanosoma conorhini]
MTIKAKPIDPGRARLAALGQWNRQGTTACSRAPPANGRGSGSRDSSIDSSTSTSSTEGCRTGRRGRRPLGNRSAKSEGSVHNGAPAFLTSPRARDSASDTSNSDPELYRAARERTARFLYPNERPALNTSSGRNNAVRELGDGAQKEVVKISLDVSPPRTPVHRPPPQPHSGKQQTERALGNSETSLASSHGGSSPPHVAPPLAVQEALQGLQETADSAAQHDFARLMDLFAADVDKEREEKHQQLQRATESEAKNAKPLVATKMDTQAPGQEGRGEVSKTYVVPPTTFDELQERALLQLYAASEDDNDSKYFIATDHMAQAFTLAALEAARKDISEDPAAALGAPGASDGSNASSRPAGTPLSLMEIVALERARRNARAGLQRRQEEEEGVTLDRNSEELLSTDADVIAAKAEASLNRFLLAVRCIESAVRDRRVTDELGRFLFAHHKPFLQAGCGKGSSEDAIREFPHEAFAVYEQYSRYVSKFLTDLLTRSVPKFDMEEFVLALFEVNMDGEYGGARDESVSMDVLSYPAWRLLLSTSSFNEFCTFMDDFIAEEYGVEKVASDGDTETKLGSSAMPSRCDESGVVVVAGARGIRALLSKSKANMAKVTAAATDDADQLRAPGEGPHGGTDASPPLPLPRDGSVTASQASQEQRQPQVHENFSAMGASVRPAFVPTTSSNSNSAFSLISGAPIADRLKTPSPPPSQHAERGKGSLGSVNSFPQLPHCRRRPEAVPGRNLPPLPAVEATEAGKFFSTVPPKLNVGSEATALLPDRSKTVSLTRGRCARGDHSGGEPTSFHESAPSSSTGVSSGRRKKSKDSRGCSGAQTGAGARGITTAKNPRGKKTPSVPRR